MSAHRLSISGHPGAYTVLLDGHDMSHTLRGVRLNVGSDGDLPRAVLDVVTWQADVDDLDAEVAIPEATRALLSRLGWTPPGDNPRPVVHIENYVAGSPEDLAAQKTAQAGSALTSPHEDVEPADTDQLLVVLFNGRYHLTGDEDAGVELHCRDPHDTSQPLGYYKGRGRYANQAVPTVTTIPALLDIAARHEVDAHQDH